MRGGGKLEFQEVLVVYLTPYYYSVPVCVNCKHDLYRGGGGGGGVCT